MKLVAFEICFENGLTASVSNHGLFGEHGEPRWGFKGDCHNSKNYVGFENLEKT